MSVQHRSNSAVRLECPSCGPMYVHLSGRIRTEQKFTCEACGDYVPFSDVEEDEFAAQFYPARAAAARKAQAAGRLLGGREYLLGDIA